MGLGFLEVGWIAWRCLGIGEVVCKSCLRGSRASHQ